MDLALAMLAGLAVMWVPGAVLLRILQTGAHDSFTRIAQQFALGLSFWPAIFLWTSIAGWTWTAPSARVCIALLALFALLFVLRSKWRTPRFDPPSIGGLGILVTVAFTRIGQIRDVALPLWVDSVHHTMIVRLLLEHGRIPSSYAPFIPEGAFYYHWGFHAVTAFAGWVSGLTSPDEVPRLLLAIGQLLNILVFFAVYAAAHTLFRDRRAALLAGTLATLVSLFPAYYVSWGRYTQLCGFLLLPPLAAAFWRAGRHPSPRRAAELAILSAGVVLIHVRIAVLFAILAALLSLLLAAQRRWRGLVTCVAVAALSLLAVAPWLLRLGATPQVRTILSPGEADRAQWETSNGAPDDLLWAPHNDLLFSLATGGLLGLTPVHLATWLRVAAIVWGLLLAALLLKRKRTPREFRFHAFARLSIIVAWFAVTVALVNLDSFGLPRLRVLPNSAIIILLFLPASLLAAYLLQWAIDFCAPRARNLSVGLTLLVAAAGASRMLHIINPETMLAQQADREALRWIRNNTPANARFAVGVQPWINGSYAGVDGGYWIRVVADRDTNLPPGLYRWVMPAARVEELTPDLDRWFEIARDGNVRALSTLRRQGITHIYFGPRNTSTLRSAIPASTDISLVYSKDGVEIYELP